MDKTPATVESTIVKDGNPLKKKTDWGLIAKRTKGIGLLLGAVGTLISNLFDLKDTPWGWMVAGIAIVGAIVSLVIHESETRSDAERKQKELNEALEDKLRLYGTLEEMANPIRTLQLTVCISFPLAQFELTEKDKGVRHPDNVLVIQSRNQHGYWTPAYYSGAANRIREYAEKSMVFVRVTKKGLPDAGVNLNSYKGKESFSMHGHNDDDNLVLTFSRELSIDGQDTRFHSMLHFIEATVEIGAHFIADDSEHPVGRISYVKITGERNQKVECTDLKAFAGMTSTGILTEAKF